MSRGLRDRVRTRLPRLLRFYQRRVAPRLRRDDTHDAVSAWAERGEELVRRTGMAGMTFGPDGVWVADRDGLEWRYTPWSFGSALGLELGVEYERAEVDILASRLAPGAVFVDVGANIGAFSIRLAHRIEDLRIIAFEAVGATYDKLRDNMRRNGVADRIEGYHLAVSDRAGTLRMTVGFEAGNFAVPDGRSAGSAGTEEVACRPLDELLAGEDRVDVIKCDVEGAELSVLRGARATLNRHRPDLLLEVDERWTRRYGHRAEDVVAFLGDLGYGYERVAGDRLRPATGDLSHDLTEGRNFLFTHPGGDR